MTQAKKSAVNYQELQAELEQIMLDLQRDDLDVDTALKRYERGLTIIKALETYLETAENKVSQLKTKFSGT